MSAGLTVHLNIAPGLDVNQMNTMLSALKQALGEFGKSIKLIDPVQLQKDMDAVKTNFVAATKTMDAGAKTVEKEMSGVTNEIKKVGEAAGGMSKTLAGAFQFNMIYGAVTQIAGAFEKVIMVGDEFEKQLKAVGAFTGTSGKQLEELGDKARDLGIKFATVGNAKSQLEIFSAVLSKMGPAYGENADAMGKFAANANVLAKAGGIEVGTAVDVMTNAMLQFGMRTGDAAKDADTSTRVINALAASARAGAAQIPQVGEAMLQVGGMAKNAQQSFEDTAAAIQVMSVGGKTGAEAGVALRNILGLMQKTSAEGASALSKMGLSARELGQTLTTKGVGSAVELLNSGLNKLPSAFEKNQAIMQLFGQENSQAFTVLSNNINRFKEFQTAISAGEAGKGTAFEMYEQKSGTAAGNIKKLKAYVEDMFISISKAMGTGLQTVLLASTQVAPMILSFGSLKQMFPDGAFNKAVDGIKKIGTTLISTLFPQYITTTTAAEAGFVAVGATEEAAGVAGATAGATTTIAWGPIIGIIAAIVAAGAGLYLFFTKTEAGSKIFEKLKIYAEQLWNVLVEGVSIVWSAISPLWDSLKWLGSFIIDTLLGAMNSIGKAIMDAFGFSESKGGDGIMSFIKNLFQQIADLLKPLVAVGKFVVEVFAVAFKIAIEAIVLYVKGMIAVYKLLWDGLVLIADWVSGAFSAVWNALIKAISAVAGAITGTFNKVKDFVSNIINWLLRVAGLFEPVKAAINGVYNFVAGIIDKVKAGVQWVIDGVNKLLGKNKEQKVDVKVNASGTQPTITPKVDTKSAEQQYKEFFDRIANIASQKASGQLVGKDLNKSITGLMRDIAGDKTITDVQRKQLEDQLKEIQKKDKQAKSGKIDSEKKLGEDLLKIQNDLEEKKAVLASKYIADTNQKELNDLDNKNKKELNSTQEQINKLTDVLSKTNKKSDKDIISQEIAALRQKYDVTNQIYQKDREALIQKQNDEAQTRKQASIEREINIKTKLVSKGVIKESELLPLIQSQIDLASQDLANKEVKLSGIKVQLAPDFVGPLPADIQSQFDNADKAVSEAETKFLDNQEKYRQSKKSIQDKEIAQMQEAEKKKEEILQKEIDAQKRAFDILNNLFQAAAQKKADMQQSADMAELDRVFGKTQQVDAKEQQYNIRKEEIERVHQQRLAAIQSMAQATQNEQQRESDLKMLEQKSDAATAQLAVMDKTADPEAYAKQVQVVTDLDKQMKEKGDLLVQNMGAIQDGISEFAGNMFTGNEEGMKKSGSKMLGMLAGIVKKLLSEIVVEQVLEAVGTEGPYGFLLAPVLYGFIYGALSAIIDPILNSITSFSTGGRIDNPTLAWVGDATNSGRNADTEWVFRDDQIAALVSMAISKALASFQANNPIPSYLTSAMQPLFAGLNDLKAGLSALVTEALFNSSIDSTAIDTLASKVAEQNTADLHNNLDKLISEVSSLSEKTEKLGDISKISEQLNASADFFANYNPEDIMNGVDLKGFISETLAHQNRLEDLTGQMLDKLQKLDRLDVILNAIEAGHNIVIDSRPVAEEVNRVNLSEASRTRSVFK